MVVGLQDCARESNFFLCWKHHRSLWTHRANWQRPLGVQMVSNISWATLVLRGVYNLAIKIHHELNFGFYALSQGEIFLYTFIWFQIGLSHSHKHSETPWYFSASKITWAFKMRFILVVFSFGSKRRGNILDVIFWVRRRALCLGSHEDQADSISSRWPWSQAVLNEQQGQQNSLGEGPVVGCHGEAGDRGSGPYLCQRRRFRYRHKGVHSAHLPCAMEHIMCV